MSQPAGVVTAEELFQYPDSKYYELVRGVPRVSEPPGGMHGRIAALIVAHLRNHVERLGLGTVLVEAGYVLQRGPDTVRGPDVSFGSLARLPPDKIVRYPDRPPRIVAAGDSLEGEDVVPGFALPMAELFGPG